MKYSSYLKVEKIRNKTYSDEEILKFLFENKAIKNPVILGVENAKYWDSIIIKYLKKYLKENHE